MNRIPSYPGSGGRVTVVGTLNVDHVWQVPVLPRPGETILASVVERQFGGKGANQAVAAARQGARVTLVGAVGDDADGQCYREHLAREGIALSALAVVPGVATGAAHVYVDPRGENFIVVDRGANARLDVAPLEAILAETDVLAMQLECPLPAVVRALQLAASRGVRSVLNASPTQRDFPWGRQPIDTVIVNEHECRDGFGLEPDAFWDLADAERVAVLARRGVAHVVITQGAEPTLLLTAAGRLSVATHRVEPRDTVGAGDMFAGTLAAELAAGQPWAVALRHANVAAALSTLAIGAQAAMPARGEVERALTKAG